MTVDEVVRVKGRKYVQTREGGRMVLRYKLSREKGILRRYNMPEYEASYSFEAGKLVRFVFGFPNP